MHSIIVQGLKIRFIQLKSSIINAGTKSQTIGILLYSGGGGDIPFPL